MPRSQHIRRSHSDAEELPMSWHLSAVTDGQCAIATAWSLKNQAAYGVSEMNGQGDGGRSCRGMERKKKKRSRATETDVKKGRDK